jgi:hypothetical protein
MPPKPAAALVQPDEHVYHVRGTYWRVAYGGKVYRSPTTTRGWLLAEARAVAASLAPRVRMDRRTRTQRFQDAGRRRERQKRGRTTRPRSPD